MSRSTFIPDVDRTSPAWVKRNEPGRPVVHNHTWLGRPVRRRVFATGADGKPVTTTQKGTRYRSVSAVLAPGNPHGAPSSVLHQAGMFRALGASEAHVLHWETDVTRLVVTHETIGRYADHCTAGERTRRDGTLVSDPGVYAPCYAELEEHDYPRPRHEATGPRVAHHTRRTRTRRLTGAAAKAYNSGYDVEEEL